MNYTQSEVEQFVVEEDVKFIRIAFVDIFGKMKNISIMPSELARAFDYGVSIDASAISGFGGDVRSDILLHPDASTISFLPWRPERGRVVRMFCSITNPDGSPFEADTRSILMKAIAASNEESVSFAFGSEMEFYLFQRDERGTPTKQPFDSAGYMDVSPEDKGENVRREICLTLERMGITPESSHHEEGPGQNEVDFRYSDPLTAADAAITFRFVVNTIAAMNGLCADFSPLPLAGYPGNGMHINVSAKKTDQNDVMNYVLAGLLKHAYESTLFFNPTEASYRRFGVNKAPKYISWSKENRSNLLRVPAAVGEFRRLELRSPDPTCNPYLAYALMIYAGLDGIRKGESPAAPLDVNLHNELNASALNLQMLPRDLSEACSAARTSAFISKIIPAGLLDCYLKLGGN
jgi:glutamine synthetase